MSAASAALDDGADGADGKAQPPGDAQASVDPRAITYAASARTGLGRAVVRVTENLTGRLPVLYRLWGFEKDLAGGEAIWDVVWRRYGLTLDARGAGLAGIPANGPAIVVANHPFGVLDGLTMGKLLWDRRRDFKILANAVFAEAPPVAPFVLPVRFDGGRDAALANLETRAQARAHLAAGGLLAVFPAGAVSSAPRAFARSADPDWKPFVAKILRESGAPITPVFFPGRNSSLFELSGRVSPALRYGLHIHEFWRRIGRPSSVVIGEPLERATLEPFFDRPPALMHRLRAAVYALSDDPRDHGPDGPPYGRRWL